MVCIHSSSEERKGKVSVGFSLARQCFGLLLAQKPEIFTFNRQNTFKACSLRQSEGAAFRDISKAVDWPDSQSNPCLCSCSRGN